jgi:(2Fe-2S) ferredoxin
VYRGCCCGTAKIPGVDHAAQLATLKSELGSVARVRAVNCLDACEQANVIVVQPSTAGRAAGGRPVWLGLVNDPDATADITTWVRAGGPGLAEPPDILDLYAFGPSRRVRRAVED